MDCAEAGTRKDRQKPPITRHPVIFIGMIIVKPAIGAILELDGKIYGRHLK
jgi:hypothetical protein